MKANVKMKALSLAVLGLAGMAFAGASMAQCPLNPASPDGPWSSKAVLSGGTLTIATPGLHATNCKMNVAVGASAASIAQVQDNTPANEARYRVRFYFDQSAVTNFGLTDAVQLFSANSLNPFPAAGGRRQMLTVSLSPGTAGAKRLIIVAACGGGANNRCTSASTIDLPASANLFEADLKVGAAAAGELKYWINAAAGPEPAATGTISNLDNAGWVGVDSAVLGLSSATPSYRTNHAAQIVALDEFDSRRLTYIGP